MIALVLLLMLGTLLVSGVEEAAVAAAVPLSVPPLNFEESPLVAAEGYNCNVPRPEDLMFDVSRGAKALEDLSVDGLVKAGQRLAEGVAASKRRYEPELSSYALGDCIKARVKCGSDAAWGHETLAAAYLNRTTSKYDYKAVLELIDEFRARRFVTEPPTDALVIHLRLGDVIKDAPDDSVERLFVCSGAAKLHHTFVKSVFELLYDAKHFANKTRVILVGGSHHALEPDDPSWFYALGIQHAFEVAGYDVSLRLSPYADDDFTFMSYATTFGGGTGGYSRIIAKLAELRGGKVVGRRF